MPSQPSAAGSVSGHSETQSPQLNPVFSILVAGHRQQRLTRNGFGPCSDKQQCLTQCLQGLLGQVHQAAEQAFVQGAALYSKRPPVFRLLTGEASGVDQLAASLASSCGYQLSYLSAQEQTQVDRFPAERRLVIGMHAPAADQPLSQDDHSLRDELALSFADMLVAVWDTREPLIVTSGTARMIRTALLRRKPVLLLRLLADQDTPQVLLNRPSALTDARLLELEALSSDTESLLAYFSLIEQETQLAVALQEWTALLLLPFMSALNTQTAESQRLTRIAQQPSLLSFLYRWLLFLVLAGRAPRPPGLGSWLSGAGEWIRVMLDPPERSQASRLLEILSHRQDVLSRRERIIARLHLFCSAIAKLNPADLRAALRPPGTSRGYHQVMPVRSEQHPIHEPELAQVFNWAEAQASCFGRRHRDGIWMIYYAAAFAVFCAVAGALSLWPANVSGLIMIWAVSEFLLLRFIVGYVLQARFRDWHGHWMSYRYLAEQLRYLRIGYPLLVLPQAFVRPLWSPQGSRREPRLLSAENWLLQRVLIATGLPESRQDKLHYSLVEHNQEMASYLQQVIDEHRQYFRRSYHNLHRDHVYLHRLAFALFFITFVAVTLHFFVKISWILIFTAFFPAWGAAIHGLLNHNEVVRMSSLASQVSGQLSVLDDACTDYQHITAARGEVSDPQRWRQTQELRQLFATLTRILSDENQHWRSLNRHNQTDLPA